MAATLWAGSAHQATAQERAEPASAERVTSESRAADVFADPRVRAVRAQLEALRDQLAAEGLPSQMIAEKVAEGLSKHVPAAPILGACQRLAQQILAARGVALEVHLPADEALIRALVDAQAVGADPAGLVDLAQAVRLTLTRQRLNSVVAATAAVAELGEREFPIADALAAVKHAVRRGGTPAVRALLNDARALVGPPSARGQSLRNASQSAPGRPASPGNSANSNGRGPPHDVGYGQSRGRGNNNGMGPNSP